MCPIPGQGSSMCICPVKLSSHLKVLCIILIVQGSKAKGEQFLHYTIGRQTNYTYLTGMVILTTNIYKGREVTLPLGRKGRLQAEGLSSH